MKSRQKYINANQLGHIRGEVVASTVDVIDIVQEGLLSGNKLKSVSLQLPKNISKADDRDTTFALENIDSGAYHKIPAGSVISKVIVSNVSGKAIDSSFSCYLGFIAPFVKNQNNKAKLAARLVDPSNPITGNLLNQNKQIQFNGQLCSANNAEINAIYDAEEKDQGINTLNVNYGVVSR